jgi:hypothetical protein
VGKSILANLSGFEHRNLLQVTIPGVFIQMVNVISTVVFNRGNCTFIYFENNYAMFIPALF